MTRERRAFTRFELDLPASMFLYQMDMYHDGTIIDLSLGGCFLPIDCDIPKGEKCRITLTTGIGLEAESVEITGEIVRSTEKGVGIQFTSEVPDSIKTLLEQVVADKQQLVA